MQTSWNRREFVALGSSLVVGAACQAGYANAAAAGKPKSVAAIATVYRKNSHADVIVSKILRGWKHDGGRGPNLRLAALYVEQIGEDDMSRDLAKEFGFPLVQNIDQAITLGTDRVAVDGVLSIGEHGDYPWNDLGQHLYPRRRFFTQIMNAFERCGQVVPVFNDKHPGPAWNDAIWMYRRAQALHVPWMAGSSLPVSFRDPDIALPMGSSLNACLAVGYSGLDIYGFHTLDFLQCFMERRSGAESGVRWVQSLPTTALPGLLEQQVLRKDVLVAGLQSSRTDLAGVLEPPPEDGAIFLIQYNDGLLVPVLMLPGRADAISVAFQVAGGPVQATRTEERAEPRYPHFAYLLKGIEQMMHTGKPSYPVERTLLAAGVLDRLLHSRKQNGERLQTPELNIRYEPVDYSYAPHIPL